jgi:hypothetical protein
MQNFGILEHGKAPILILQFEPVLEFLEKKSNHVGPAC